MLEIFVHETVPDGIVPGTTHESPETDGIHEDGGVKSIHKCVLSLLIVIVDGGLILAPSSPTIGTLHPLS